MRLVRPVAMILVAVGGMGFTVSWTYAALVWVGITAFLSGYGLGFWQGINAEDS